MSGYAKYNVELVPEFPPKMLAKHIPNGRFAMDDEGHLWQRNYGAVTCITAVGKTYSNLECDARDLWLTLLPEGTIITLKRKIE